MTSMSHITMPRTQIRPTKAVRNHIMTLAGTLTLFILLSAVVGVRTWVAFNYSI